MSLKPENIALIGNEVAIRWSDGSEDYYPMEFLRAASPSASTAGEKDIFGNVYGATDPKKFPGVTVTGFQAVGGYAIQFQFSDGHNTGLYSHELLKKLAEHLRSNSGHNS